MLVLHGEEWVRSLVLLMPTAPQRVDLRDTLRVEAALHGENVVTRRTVGSPRPWRSARQKGHC